MSYDREKLRAELERDEGKQSRPYICPAGFTSIGIGHNLQAKPLSDAAIAMIFAEDVHDAETDLDSLLPGWRGLEDDLQRVLVNMSFQLGRERLGGFRKFLTHARELIAAQTHEDRRRARDAGAREMLDSMWADQTPARAKRLAARWIGAALLVLLFASPARAQAVLDPPGECRCPIVYIPSPGAEVCATWNFRLRQPVDFDYPQSPTCSTLPYPPPGTLVDVRCGSGNPIVWSPRGEWLDPVGQTFHPWFWGGEPVNDP